MPVTFSPRQRVRPSSQDGVSCPSKPLGPHKVFWPPWSLFGDKNKNTHTHVRVQVIYGKCGRRFCDPETVLHARPCVPPYPPRTHQQPSLPGIRLAGAKDAGVRGAVLGADWLRVVKRSEGGSAPPHKINFNQRGDAILSNVTSTTPPH